jgi:uncharacterized protein
MLEVRIYLPDVRQKKGEPVHFRFEGRIPEHFSLSQPWNGSLCLDLDARIGADKIVVSGSFEAVIDAECSRCLQPFRQKFKSDFQEAFTMRPATAESEDPETLAAEAANELTVTGDYLYLEEYIRQVFVLAQVYNPLCNPDCQGICAGCGADLNSSACRCAAAPEPDDRLAKLKELKHDG